MKDIYNDSQVGIEERMNKLKDYSNIDFEHLDFEIKEVCRGYNVGTGYGIVIEINGDTKNINSIDNDLENLLYYKSDNNLTQFSFYTIDGKINNQEIHYQKDIYSGKLAYCYNGKKLIKRNNSFLESWMLYLSPFIYIFVFVFITGVSGILGFNKDAIVLNRDINK